jgi:hypothetical protein
LILPAVDGVYFTTALGTHAQLSEKTVIC